MNLPDLSKMDLSKKATVVIFACYFLKDVVNIVHVAILATLVGLLVVCQTYIDVHKKPAPDS